MPVVYRTRIGKIFYPGGERILLFRVVVELKRPHKGILSQELLGCLCVTGRSKPELSKKASVRQVCVWRAGPCV